jgi:membrane protein implicated in regulation of membrane protease activity
MKKLNEFIANKLALIMSSMWLFWVLALVILIAGLLQPPDTPYTFVMFVISAGFQAVALPVLAFISNIQGEKQAKMLKETHDTVMKELKILREENAELRIMVEKQKKAK